jgi:hypothetical protein
MIGPDRLASWRRKATPELLEACNEIERLHTGLTSALDALRCGEDDEGGQILTDLLAGEH